MLIAASVWMKFFIIDNAHAATANRADDPHGDCLAETKWIADREHNVARARFLAIGKGDCRQIFLVDFEQRNVGPDRCRLFVPCICGAPCRVPP